MKAETITAADSTRLVARVYEGGDTGSVVIGGAMGVRRLAAFASPAAA
jgi:hypothetical protein